MKKQTVDMGVGMSCRVCSHRLCVCDERINHFFEYEGEWSGNLSDGKFVWVKSPNKLIEMAILCCILFAEQEQAVV